jgi:hypothetical protein
MIKRYKRSRRVRRAKYWRTRRRGGGGGDKKCLFINWGPEIGLGNQLFIYAAGVIMKKKLKDWDLCIPPVENNFHSSTDYRFLFKQGIPVERTSEIRDRIKDAVVIHKAREVRHSEWSDETLAKNSGDQLDNPKIDLRMKSNATPEDEFYHNYKAIEPAIETLRRDLQEELDKLYAKDSPIKDPATAAFLHIRYGDYKKLNLVGRTEYYKKARARLEEQSNIHRIFMISDKDGLVWATKEGLMDGCSKPIHPIGDADELKVLYIMSQCKAGACISSSTFSIWGAILGPGTNPESTITYPSWWVSTDVKNLSFPKRWIQI